MATPWGAIVPLGRYEEFNDLLTAATVIAAAGSQAIVLEEQRASELDPFVVLSAIGQRCPGLGLGALLVDVVDRPPSIIAKLLAGVDVCSADRGAVWIGELDGTDQGPAQILEALTLIHTMSRQDVTTMSGQYFHVDVAWNTPRATVGASPAVKTRYALGAAELLTAAPVLSWIPNGLAVEMSSCSRSEYRLIEEMLGTHAPTGDVVAVLAADEPVHERALIEGNRSKIFDALVYRWRRLPEPAAFASMLDELAGAIPS